jgi:hypothetical protein
MFKQLLHFKNTLWVSCQRHNNNTVMDNVQTSELEDALARKCGVLQYLLKYFSAFLKLRM